MKVHGRLTFLSLTDAGAVVRNLSSFLNSVDHPAQTDMAEVSVFNTADKAFIPGLKSRTIKVSGFWDATATTGPDDVLSGLEGGGADGTITTSYVYGPGGSATGAVKYTGTAYLSNYSRTNPVGGAVTFSADLQCTGAETRTTF